MIMERALSSTRIEQLREHLNDKNYLYTAIQRIAVVLSNELVEMSPGGGNYYERQRKRRR